MFYTGTFVCVFRSDSYSNTHIRAKCNSSQWNVLTTKRPRIALVDNRHTHTSSLFFCTAHQSSINTDYSDIDLFFARFHHSAFFLRVSGSSRGRLYRFPKRTAGSRTRTSSRLIQVAVFFGGAVSPPCLHHCCHHQHVFSTNNPALLKYCDKRTQRHGGVTFPARCFSNETGFGKLAVRHAARSVLMLILRIQINKARLTHLRLNDFKQQEAGMRRRYYCAADHIS